MKTAIDYIGVSVGAFILNEKKEVFLLKRGKNSRNDWGMWKFPGGEVEFGETREDALKRELKEEIGVSIDWLTLFTVNDEFFDNKKEHWIANIFLVKLLKGEEPKNLEPHKHDKIGWFPFNKLPKPLAQITRVNISKYKKG